MMVIAVDTSSEEGSLALAREDGLCEMVALPSRRHSTTLHAEIARLLARHGLGSRDVQGYGVTTGPGSFTGVRVGLTAVKGLAEVSEKPVVAISTLEALATSAQAESCRWTHSLLAPAFVPITNARRGQIFGAIYRQDGDRFRPLLEDTVCSLRCFLERVKAASLPELAFCGTDLDPFVPEIEEGGWGMASRVPVPPLLAGTLGQITIERLQKGQGMPARNVDANYVRRSDAELFWKE